MSISETAVIMEHIIVGDLKMMTVQFSTIEPVQQNFELLCSHNTMNDLVYSLNFGQKNLRFRWLRDTQCCLVMDLLSAVMDFRHFVDPTSLCLEQGHQQSVVSGIVQLIYLSRGYSSFLLHGCWKSGQIF